MRAIAFPSTESMGTILKLSWPIMAAMASQNLMNLVDTAMIGTLGAVPLAGVGLASIALWVMSGLLQGIGSSVQAMTARRAGEKHQDRLHEAMINAFFVILVAGVPYAYFLWDLSSPIFRILVQDPGVQTAGTAYLDIRLLTLPIIGLNFAFRGYFNGVQRPKVYMSTLLLMHPLNILLNYLLIFGNFGFPALGVRGAAIGTVIATTLGCSIFALLMFAGERARMRSLFGLVSKKAMGTLLKLAIPSGLQSLSLAGGYLVFFRIAGMVSTEALAGVNILVNLGLIGILISMGIGLGTLTLVGNALGERDTAQARGWVRSALLLVTLLVGSLGLILAGFPEFWLGIFIQDPKVIQVAVIPIILLGLSQSYDGAAMVLMHAHLGGGAVKTVMVVSFVTQWLVFLPACYIWVSFFNGQLVHLYICMITYRFLLFLAFYLSIRKERWLSIAI